MVPLVSTSPRPQRSQDRLRIRARFSCLFKTRRLGAAAGDGSVLKRAAEPRRVRPRAEAPAASAGLLRHPDLLERRPVIGGALQAVEPPAVVELERDVHLEAAVVRPPAVVPRRLVAVDAEPDAVVGRM